MLAHASQAVERIRPLEAVPTLTTEAAMTLVIVGHLREATRRGVDERRGADSTSVLDRLAARGLLTQRTDQAATGRPNAYRLTTRALTLVGHSTLESFQAWCRQQMTPRISQPACPIQRPAHRRGHPGELGQDQAGH